MSHRATNWAVEQRGIPPIAKVVLWHLADRHNPDNGCFPDQATLADSVEVSRSSINRHLTELENAGLIRREPRVDPLTKKQLPTRYRLAFEEGFEPLHIVARVPSADTENRVSETGESVSQEQAVPCVTADTLTSKLTGKENQEKNARTRLDPTEGLAVVAPGTSDFDCIKRARRAAGKNLIVGKSGSATVTIAELEQARAGSVH